MENFYDSFFGDNLPCQNKNKFLPLAARMRPLTLEQIVGQEKIISKDSLLPRLIKSNSFGSLLFYGPAGCGKTSLAEVIANETKSTFVRINAVLSNVAQLRDVLKEARLSPNKRTIVFIDEIHRFNKSQQDLLLPDVESGAIRLIGATTHNPAFYINPPLISRSHLFKLEPLSVSEIVKVLKNALYNEEKGLGLYKCTAQDDILEDIAIFSNGDTRRALNALETIVMSADMAKAITKEDIISFSKERHLRYDANEDEHYNIISAFIKSVRGSDQDAGLYWLFRMLKGGEDPRFIARRLIILASEDIGLADSRALQVATNALTACEFVGMPECQYALAHATIFLALCPKSNSVTKAIESVKNFIDSSYLQEVPLHLRDSHNKLNIKLGNAKDYKYPHDFPSNYVEQSYMQTPHTFYVPQENGSEKTLFEKCKNIKNLSK